LQDAQIIIRERQDLYEYVDIWVFGYGSLIYKVDFPYIARRQATINHWQRRFWMLSHDHRGTPENPGIVLTLTPCPNTSCFGMAYKITENEFEHLDHREKNGYLREVIEIQLNDQRLVKGFIYIGDVNSPVYLGETPIDELAKHIHNSRGPSGENRDYVFALADSLKEHSVVDEHVFALEQQLREKAK